MKFLFLFLTPVRIVLRTLPLGAALLVFRTELPAQSCGNLIFKAENYTFKSTQVVNHDMGTSALQYQSLTDPGDAQGVQFAVRFSDDAKSGKYFLNFYYYVWPVGSPRPSSPTQCVTKEVTFRDPPFRYPDGVGLIVYDLPLQSGMQCQLAETMAVSEASACATAEPGTCLFTNDGVNAVFALGRRTGNWNAGLLQIKSANVTASLYTPSSLFFLGLAQEDVVVVKEGEVLRQVRAPQVFADIVTTSPSAYEVRFYQPTQVRAPDETSGISAVSGAAFATYIISNPDSTPLNRLQIMEMRDSQQKVSVYAYDPLQNVMTLSTGNGLRHEAVAIVADSSGKKVRTHTIKDANKQVVSVANEVVQTFPWGESVVSAINDPEGAALTSTFTYYTDPSDTVNYGHMKQRQEANGAWEKLSYDREGRVIKRVRPRLNTTPEAPETQSRVLSTTYGTIDDLDGDGLPESLETIVETSVDGESHRVYRITFSKFETQPQGSIETSKLIECSKRGATWDDPSNLVTTMRVFHDGDLENRSVSLLKPQGALTTYTYASDAETLTTTTLSGPAASDGTTVLKGTATVITETLLGRPVSSEVLDYPSGSTLTMSVVTAQDSFGRATRIDHADGTHEAMSYACCGVGMMTDRAGTAKQVNYNALGYVDNVVQASITQHTVSDPENRTLSVTQIGADGSSTATTTNRYDLAGRLVWTQDAMSRQTTYQESIDADGNTVKTTIYPDGGARIEETAKDGTPISVTGSAVQQQVRFEYGSDEDGAYTKEIHLGDNGDTTEWTKTYFNLAVHPSKIVYPDGSVREIFYNNRDQLVKEIDPDGVTTLFAYDDQGEQEYKTIDLNRNGEIDFDGEDRITRVHRDVITDHDVTVARAMTSAWDQTGVDQARTLAMIEATPDGSQTWETSLGLTTYKKVLIDGNGGRAETSTLPDGTVVTKQFKNNLLISEVKTAELVQISGAYNTYDSRGNLSTSTDSRKGTTTYSYYDDGHLRTVTSPDPDPNQTGAGLDPLTITYAYDAAGRRREVVQSDGSVTHTEYYPNGLVQKTWGSKTYPQAYTYDSQGRTKTLTTWQNYADNKGASVTTWNYDPMRGFLTSKIYADGQGVHFAYSPAGRLASRLWARGATATYTYNNAGDLVSTRYSDNTASVTGTYDRLGRPSTITDASGTMTRSYDARAEGVATESYDNSGLLSNVVVTRGFDNLNRVSLIAAALSLTPFTQADYGYDFASRLLTVTAGANAATYSYVTNSALVGSIAFQHSGASRLTTTKTYDNLDHLTSTSSSPSASPAVSFAYNYDALEQRQKVTREDDTQWSYQYDSKGQVTKATKSLPDGTAALGYNFSYAFEDIGNRSRVSVNSHASSYSVNALNEVTQRTAPRMIEVTGSADPEAHITVNGDPSQRRADAFYKAVKVSGSNATYAQIDIVGKLNGSSDVARETRHAFVPADPEIYTYDADGNLLSDGQWQYTWDAENRLSAIQTQPTLLTPAGPLPVTEYKRLEFAYDAQSRRIQKRVLAWTPNGWNQVSERRFVYDSWNLLAEYDPAQPSALRTYTWGLSASGDISNAAGVGGLLFIASPIASGFTAYDGNGSVVALIDAVTGETSSEYGYDSFGNILQMSDRSDLANPFRFSTKYVDDETGLTFYGFRYYNSATGRWLNRDPLGEKGGVNEFAFVNNDPLNQIDPYGLSLGSWIQGTVSWAYRNVRIYGVIRVAYQGGFTIPNLTALKYQVGVFGYYASDRSATISGYGYLYVEWKQPVVLFGVNFDLVIQPQLGFSGVVWCAPFAKTGWSFYDSPGNLYCGGYLSVNLGVKAYLSKTISIGWASIGAEAGGFVGGRYTWPQNRFAITGYVYIAAVEQWGSWKAKEEVRLGTTVDL